LVVTVKSAMEPNTRKELALDMSGLAFRGQSDQQGMLDVRFDTTCIQLLKRGFENP
jgi:hypothetical protein